MSGLRTVAMAALVASACGGSDDVVASDAVTDAPSACTDFTTAELGQCINGSGGLCDGLGPDNSFEAIVAGQTVNMVQGFQGSPMIALAVRTTDIAGNDGGAPADDPTIVGRAFDAAEQQIASYFNSVAFTEVPGSPGTFEMLSVFLVINGPPESVAGTSVTVNVSVIDTNGEQRCGALDFIAGAIQN